MVDIHCHLLPGLDDGPDSLEESVAMAQQAVADGITHVIATPHANDLYAFEPERIARARQDLLARTGTVFQLGAGCDFHLSFENLKDAAVQPQKYTLNQKNYLLVEFANFAIPPAIDEYLKNLQSAGVRPVITHPERNGLLRNSPARLHGWLEQGCYVQITAQSFLGRFGVAAQKSAESLLDAGAVHFVASDAHNSTSRPLKLREAFECVAKHSGPEVAQALFHDNPLAAFEGRALPYVPELAEAEAAEPKRRKFFFF